MSNKVGRPPLPEGTAKTATLRVALTPTVKEAVEAQAQSRDIPASQVVRTALVEYLRGTEDSINE